MIYGVFGNRDVMPVELKLAGASSSDENPFVPYENYDYIAKQLDAFSDIDGLILGGGVGVETLAHRWAVARNIPFTIIKPKFGKGTAAADAFKSRNVLIIERSHRLIMFWDGAPNGPLGGVLSDAMTLKKEVHLLPLEI